MATAIEANWLWDFLQRRIGNTSLLSRAQTVASMSLADKVALRTWVQTVSALTMQFQPKSQQWPIICPITNSTFWKAFKELMEAFYERGFRTGLPYMTNGTPTATGGVDYAYFVNEFRTQHRLNQAPDAREVCVFCGGPLGQIPEIDHWIAKGKYPLLSICADNLIPICGDCNSTSNKGDKDVHSAGGFRDWYHPYLRPGFGDVQLRYGLLPDISLHCEAVNAANAPNATNLDSLLNLSARWTREFKAEYENHRRILIQRERYRIAAAKARHTRDEVQNYIVAWQDDLVASEPHYEVYQALTAAALEPDRVSAWHSELSSMQ
jgi:hypothetical protein